MKICKEIKGSKRMIEKSFQMKLEYWILNFLIGSERVFIFWLMAGIKGLPEACQKAGSWAV